MRWMWIDRVVELVPRVRIVAVKTVSLSEEHLHDHFASAPGRAALPLMPASLIVEGVAQSGGILVGHASGFREKVVLAKVSAVDLDADAQPGSTLRYTVEMERYDGAGASTRGTVEVITQGAHGPNPARPIGRVDLLFSHLDRNMAGAVFPEHNFVFSESFRTLLVNSGIAAPFAEPRTD
ncbi:MAG TPA: beta-hydroxyacyl-ACP dehydratase [Phycisphaerales bacterium]|nr:beta-hydroxyacyl-ACP dehydratase [Phycisphaerales bacterium]